LLRCLRKKEGSKHLLLLHLAPLGERRAAIWPRSPLPTRGNYFRSCGRRESRFVFASAEERSWVENAKGKTEGDTSTVFYVAEKKRKKKKKTSQGSWKKKKKRKVASRFCFPPAGGGRKKKNLETTTREGAQNSRVATSSSGKAEPTSRLGGKKKKGGIFFRETATKGGKKSTLLLSLGEEKRGGEEEKGNARPTSFLCQSTTRGEGEKIVKKRMGGEGEDAALSFKRREERSACWRFILIGEGEKG